MVREYGSVTDGRGWIREFEMKFRKEERIRDGENQKLRKGSTNLMIYLEKVKVVK